MRVYLRLALAALVIAGLCSCQSAPQSSDRAGSGAAVSAAGRDSATLAYRLAQKTWCSNDEACCLVIQLTDGEDRHDSFAARRAYLGGKEIIPAGWNMPADAPVTKGTLAYMLCRSLDVKGGLFMHLLPSRRYAYREAVHLELMARGSEYEPLTGPEAVGIMGRAARISQQTN